MGVVDTKSTAVTNAEASPPGQTGAFIANGMMRTSVGVVQIAAGDDDTSVYRFFRIPSNARMSELIKYSDAIAGGTDFNIGVRETTENGGGTISGGDNLFGDAVSLATADTVGTNVLFENNNIDNIEKRIWELLGLTEDPRKEYDVVAVGETVGTVAGGVALEGKWTV